MVSSVDPPSTIICSRFFQVCSLTDFNASAIVASLLKHTVITDILGSQAVIASIDYKIINNKPILFTNNGINNTQRKIIDWIKECEDLGVGEFFLNSIDRDGTGKGFDIKTINIVIKNTSLPVIACGGAGTEEHFYMAFANTDINALSAANFFHFKENSYPNLKKFLYKKKIKIR